MEKLKKIFFMLILAIFVLVGCSDSDGGSENTAMPDENAELSGDIVMWHSFTQGPRLESIQKSADEFMEEHPEVNIEIHTFSWNDFYTKWTTGLTSGNIPDISTALPNHVVEMINADALVPLNDFIDHMGKDRFTEAALSEGQKGDNFYSVPLYSHAQVMWVRKDLLDKEGYEVPKTWDEFYEVSKALTKDDVYGVSVPMGTNDFMATRFLNFYVRSAGESLLTEDLKVDLTSDIAQEGIKFWTKLYEEVSPEDSINYDVLQQATLYYQGRTAFDFNSGFQISGVETNTPQLLDSIDAYPIPKHNVDDPDYGIETSNIPMVVWKNSEHVDVAKAFLAKLYEDENYIEFLNATPVGMLPSISGISDLPQYKEHEVRQKFSHAEEVIANAAEKGTAIGFEHGPSVEAGILLNQHIIEEMFQDIVTNGTDSMEAAKTAEDKLNELFQATNPN